MQTVSAVAVDHYRRVGSWIVRHLGGVPLVTAFYVDGSEATYAASLHGPAPGDEATVDVVSAAGRVQYLALTASSVLYEAHRGAVEVHSWSPRAADSARAVFARVLVRPDADRPAGFAAMAARAVRAQLQARALDGIALRDGAGTVCVWVPLSDGPGYAEVRLWLHEIVGACVAADPALRAHEFHVTSNAVGHWSLVPYSLIGADAATVVTPVRWDELDLVTEPVGVGAFAVVSDDVFDAEVRRIGEQRLGRPLDKLGVTHFNTVLTPGNDVVTSGNDVVTSGDALATARVGRVMIGDVLMVSGEGHGRILAAVRAVLADERAHSAGEICALGIARGLLPVGTIPAYVQHGIATLLDRQRDRGEKAEFLLLADGTYRLNVPVNPFAGHVEPARDRTQVDTLIARLRAAVVRDVPADPEDGPNIGAPFERAVADALGFLGLAAQRLGGEGEPDVVATAPMGVAAYRVAFECKTVASMKLHGSAGFVAEAARMRDRIGATYAVLLGLDFPDERGIAEELGTHRVALWTLADLIAVMECQLDHPVMWSALVPLLAPGRAADAVTAFRAEHLHGAHQRAHVVLRYVMEEGLAYQESLADGGDALSADALAVLVNQRLGRETDAARCSVADVRAALAFAASPVVGGVSLHGDGFVVERRVGADRG
jgi:DNA primase